MGCRRLASQPTKCRCPADSTRPASGPYVGAAECAQPGLPAGADVQPGELVEHQAQRRQHPARGVGRRVVEVADQHRSPRRDHQRSRSRPGIPRCGQDPSGTARPALPGCHPGVSSRRAFWHTEFDGPSSTPDCSPPISANSVTRQARGFFDETQQDLRSGSRDTPPARRCHVRSTAVGNTCTPTSAPRPDTSARAVVETEPEPAQFQPGLGRIAASSHYRTHARTSASRPPAWPDSGEATIFSTRSCVAGRQQPASLYANPRPLPRRGSRAPGHCRAVSSSVAEIEKSLATLAGVASCAAVIIPPGSRIQPAPRRRPACRNAPGRPRHGSRPPVHRTGEWAHSNGQGVDCAHRGGFEAPESPTSRHEPRGRRGTIATLSAATPSGGRDRWPEGCGA